MNQQTVEHHDRDVETTGRPLLSRQTGQRTIGDEEIVLVDFLPIRFATHHVRVVEAVEADCESVFGFSTDDSPLKPCSHYTAASVKKHKKNKKKSKQSKFHHAWGSSASLHLSSRSFFESSGSTLSSISEEPFMLEDQQLERSRRLSCATRSRMMDSVGLEDDALPKNARAIGCGFPVHPSSEKVTWGAAPWDYSFADDSEPFTAAMDDCATTSRGGSSVDETQSTESEFILWPSFVAMETPQEITVVNDDWSGAGEADEHSRPHSERDGESAHIPPIVRPGTFRKREPQVTNTRRRRSKDIVAGPSSSSQNDIRRSVCTVACPLTPASDDASTTEVECSPSSFGSTSETPRMRNRKTLPSRTFHRLSMTLPWRRSLMSCEVSNGD